ncbi:MAG TPA: proton-conducting transporter membrane subunit [Methanospirillum sp.]|nr:proton-conducting transporter membrane subunit [Methanospirillum sp.]
MINTNLLVVIQVELLLFLILFPLIPAIIVYFLRNDGISGLVVTAGAGICALGSILLLVTTTGENQAFFTLPVSGIALLMMAVEVLIAGYLVAVSLKAKEYFVTVVVIIQLLLIGVAEWFALQIHSPIPDLLTDQFSGIMAVIIGVIGGLICMYAVGYMRDYQVHHSDQPDRRPQFFAILFIFLSAMFGLVFSNNLFWMYFFWEVTTLCSYLLIRYPETQEAITNAYRALLFNLVGGICFPVAILVIIMGRVPEYLGLGSLIEAGPTIALIPASLIAIAGCAKSAQFPFSSWLVGAMVAPTPVSALLHSSTMVKAGVYVIVRFSPVFEGQLIGILIALIGGITFLIASCIAVNMSNAKKILAYSTIANLGLVVACAGVGTPEAVWAAILLIIFHAIAKSLLFLSVGSVSHRIGSLDLEDMTGLITTMPRVATMMLIGIAGMFLAPFGMLISKWASLHAFVEVAPPFGIILVLILAYGSAITAFFWAKWMGKLIQGTYAHVRYEEGVSSFEWIALYIITALTIIVCALFPFISWYMIEPYLSMYYPTVSHLISLSNVEIMIMMLFLVLMMPFSLSYFKRTEKRIPRYMGGLSSVNGQTYIGSFGTERRISLSNYYLDSYFEEARLSRYGVYLAGLLFMILLIMIEGGL